MLTTPKPNRVLGRIKRLRARVAVLDRRVIVGGDRDDIAREIDAAYAEAVTLTAETTGGQSAALAAVAARLRDRKRGLADD